MTGDVKDSIFAFEHLLRQILKRKDLWERHKFMILDLT